MLDYVYDLRLHPGITYLNKGLKVIICPDDPGFLLLYIFDGIIKHNLKNMKIEDTLTRIISHSISLWPRLQWSLT